MLISFTFDDIESILDLQYGHNKTFSALILLYPSLNYSFKYHQDHIHPKSFFNKRKLNELGIEDDLLKQEFIFKYNKLPNLQLLQSTQNIEKNNMHFERWLDELYENDADKKNYLLQNHIRSDASLNFIHFIEFYEQRRLTLRKRLMEVLNITPAEEIASN